MISHIPVLHPLAIASGSETMAKFASCKFVEPSSLEGSDPSSGHKQKGPQKRALLFMTGGERGIRTLDGL